MTWITDARLNAIGTSRAPTYANSITESLVVLGHFRLRGFEDLRDRHEGRSTRAENIPETGGFPRENNFRIRGSEMDAGLHDHVNRDERPLHDVIGQRCGLDPDSDSGANRQKGATAPKPVRMLAI